MQNKHEKAERAKIFLPFDSLKGFRECLQSKERVIANRKQLSQDTIAYLNRILYDVVPGELIKVIYYDVDAYIVLEGMVVRLDSDQQMIQIVDKVISMKDIIEIHRTNDMNLLE